MKPSPKFGSWLTILVLATSLLSLAAQEITQTFNLRAGWNSIYMEVRPSDPSPGSVFEGLPLESVWTYKTRLSAVDFIQNLTQPIGNKNEWLVFVPTNRLESFQNNLSQIQANRAYLVKLTNAATLQVTGRPSLRSLDWLADAYNLRGFPIDPASPPTFEQFFRPSAAHYVNNQLQRIYQIASSGQWTPVNSSDLMRPGEAYWVYTVGASDYQAPLTVRVEIGDGLDYGKAADTLRLTIYNRRPADQAVNIQDLILPGANALSYSRLNPTNSIEWVHLLPNPPLPSSLSVAAGDQLSLRLAIRREDFSTPTYATTLEIKDGAGTRIRVPVSAQKAGVGGAANLAGKSLKRASLTGGDEARSLAGLWVGTASIKAVSEAHTGTLLPATTNLVSLVVNSNGIAMTNWVPETYVRTNVSLTPTATPGEFNLRLLLHVDENGDTRLLKEVIQMWQNGTTTNDAQGYKVQATPGHFVLVTDESLLPKFTGATMRDGVPVGRRLSTAAFDFDGNELLLTGSFAINQAVAGRITLNPNSPTNPFRHKYHPDHDNRNARYDGTADPPEVYTVTREFELQFAPAPANAPPGYGYSVLGGIYRETFTGLHRTKIVVSGPFRLQRVALNGTLNQ